MELNEVSNRLAHELGNGFVPQVTAAGSLEFRRVKSGDQRLPFSMGTITLEGVTFERLVISAETLKGPKWVPTDPHSGFQHSPKDGEIWYFYCGALWVLSVRQGKIVVFERK